MTVLTGPTNRGRAEKEADNPYDFVASEANMKLVLPSTVNLSLPFHDLYSLLRISLDFTSTNTNRGEELRLEEAGY